MSFAALLSSAGPARANETANSISKTSLTLEQALTEALANNPEISSAKAKAQTEEARVGLARSLPNPRLGVMRENNLTSDQVAMGPMNSVSISQEIMFPAKYALMGDAQKATARAASHRAQDTRLSVRQKVVSAYVGLYSKRQILSLLEAQRETLREVARIAESRRATGAVPQQDEMKAHVEQTMLENEILMQKQELGEAEAMLGSLLGRSPMDSISIAAADFKAPALKEKKAAIEKIAVERSESLASSREMVSEAETMLKLSKFSYAPDFMLSFRKPFTNAPSDAYAISLDITVPLWFFSRQKNEVAAASAAVTSAKADTHAMSLEIRSLVRALSEKAESFEKMLRVFETSLIPQATSSLNSARSAYASGKSGFMELLDAERSLYQVRIDYYKALSKYADAVAALEKTAGVSLSTLPFGENQ
jgi:outer membrane protein TolC